MEKGEIILYQPNETIKLEVRLEEESVWLTRHQLALLFNRDVKTIGKHINMPCVKNWMEFQLSQNLRQLLLMANVIIRNIIIWT